MLNIIVTLLVTFFVVLIVAAYAYVYHIEKVEAAYNEGFVAGGVSTTIKFMSLITTTSKD